MVRVNSSAKPPGWVVLLGSVFVLLHLFWAVVTALNVESGPWALPGMNESAVALAPPFANSAATSFGDYYTQLVKITSNFRFNSLRQQLLEIAVEAIVRDDSGKVVTRYKLPDPEASGFVQYRQRMGPQKVGNVTPPPPQTSVIIPAPGQKLEPVRYWVSESERRLILKEEDPNAVPRNQNFMQPSPWQYIVAKSYVRHILRQQPKTRVELVRSWYDPVNP
ncbi:MAG TPA: hypothetical protein PKA06_10670, partial [Gemmatales bacterium]|nr:hypothetical protein [Gemmatales bacterium]